MMEIEYKFYIESEVYLHKVLNSDFWDQFKTDQWSKHHFIAHYFDTKDLILSKNKLSLRIREEDSNKVLTIKTAKTTSENGALSRRGEWNFSWNQENPDIGILLDSLGNKLENNYLALLYSVKDKKLHANMSTDVIRYKKNIYIADTQVEVVLDLGKLYGGKLSDNIQEMELELISGDETKLIKLADLLNDKFELVAGEKSKMQRCLELLEKSKTI